MQPIDHKTNIIELNAIYFSYDGHEKTLDNISFALHKGDYLGIIGPNGGGKSTLLKIMLGLLKPTSGSIKLFGQTIKDFKDWSKIGYVPQKAAYFDNNFPATVKEVVAMGRYAKKGLFRFLTKADDEKIDKALEQVDMHNYKNKQIGNLSGGQQQRIFIARALATEPEVIFLDEPTAGVDVSNQEQFYELLRKLNRELDLTLVLVSHELDVVAKEATEVACINSQLISYCTPSELAKQGKLEQIYGHDLKYILHQHQNH
ncbi:metal ABC transporter ATP-binding protein [Candidatus Roizmanbacteria bacterium]|nr:metal ABC transporter ATP-binding protein [Candidatus Roizmanbacteria bacterium]